MAIKIVSVNLNTGYTWQEEDRVKDWSAIKNTNPDWSAVKQTTEVGRSLIVEVEVSDGTWSGIKDILPSWEYVKTKFASWLDAKNW